MEYLTMLAVTSLVSFLDVDRSFTFPKDKMAVTKIVGLILAYVGINFVVCCLLYSAAESTKFFSVQPGIGLGLTIAIAFPLLLKSKFLTYKDPDSQKKTSIGLDLVHEAFKSFVYKRVNFISKTTLEIELRQQAESSNLGDLVAKAKRFIMVDGLMSNDQQTEDVLWLQKIIASAALTNIDKKEVLCWYLKTGKKAV